MKKLPFSPQHREKIEEGRYQVKTNDGHDVRIICWDKKGNGPDRVVGLVKGSSGVENAVDYSQEGRCISDGSEKRAKDIYILTDEPELTPFEEKLKEIVNSYADDGQMTDEGAVYYANQLLNTPHAEESWHPLKEQINGLEWVIELFKDHMGSEFYELGTLLTDLKKLGAK